MIWTKDMTKRHITFTSKYLNVCKKTFAQKIHYYEGNGRSKKRLQMLGDRMIWIKDMTKGRITFTSNGSEEDQEFLLLLEHQAEVMIALTKKANERIGDTQARIENVTTKLARIKKSWVFKTLSFLERK